MVVGKEIERKFSLYHDGEDRRTDLMREFHPEIIDLKDHVLRNGDKIRQGYLPIDLGEEIARDVGVQVDFEPLEARLRHQADKHFITFKGDGELDRPEVPDHPILKSTFDLYWDYAIRRVEKVRLTHTLKGIPLEIDVYTNRNDVIVEVEASSIELAQSVPLLGLDVTNDPTYRNRSMATPDFDRDFILTSGPKGGKTVSTNYMSLLQYPVAAEAAREIIEREQELKNGVVPWERFMEFQHEVLALSKKIHDALKGMGTAYLDRGIADGIGYCLEAGYEPPTPLLDEVRRRPIHGVFVLEPLPYAPDGTRKESPEKAARIHQSLMQLYDRLGFQPTTVPVDLTIPEDLSIRKRAHYIIEKSHSM